ncbi:hypothetical protein IJV79_01470, partial [bacterium]|nr:hypothetical protein [bacterium]
KTAAEELYGPISTWDEVPSNVEDIPAWWNKYMAPFIETSNIEVADGVVRFTLADGSVFAAGSARDWYYRPIYQPIGAAFNYFIEKPSYSDTASTPTATNKGFIPYIYGMKENELTVENLKTKCYDDGGRAYCTAYIQANGGKIPDDYPHEY